MKRSTLVTGIVAAAVVGSVAPAWAFWTVTSDATATAAAKATTLNATFTAVVTPGTPGQRLKFTLTPMVGGPPSIYSFLDITNPNSPTVNGDCAFPTSGSTRVCTTGNAFPNGGTFRITATLGSWTGFIDCFVDTTRNGTCAPAPTMMSLGAAKASAPADSSATADSGKSKPSAPAEAPAPDVVVASPARPSAPRVSAADDSGSSASDGITNAVSPRVVGTAEPGSTVIVRNGGTELGRSTAGANGGYELAMPLAEGSHELTAVAGNAAGESAPSAASTVRIDRTAPELTLVAGGAGADRALSGSLGTAAGDAPEVQLGADNGATLGKKVDAAGGAFSTGITVELGTTTVTATQVDEAGNTATATVTIEREVEPKDPGTGTAGSGSDAATEPTSP